MSPTGRTGFVFREDDPDECSILDLLLMTEIRYVSPVSRSRKKS